MQRRLGLALLVAMSVWSHPSKAISRDLTQAEVCTMGNLVVIGTVVSNTSRVASDGPHLVSDIAMTVERRIHGPSIPTVNFTVMGGKTAQYWQRVAEVPRLDVGSRYLIFFNKQPGQPAKMLADHLWWYIDPNSALPTEQQLQEQWNNECEPQ